MRWCVQNARCYALAYSRYDPSGSVLVGRCVKLARNACHRCSRDRDRGRGKEKEKEREREEIPEEIEIKKKGEKQKNEEKEEYLIDEVRLTRKKKEGKPPSGAITHSNLPSILITSHERKEFVKVLKVCAFFRADN